MLVTLKEILETAQKKGYGVGYFNTMDTDMLEAGIAAAEECRSPIIIGTAEALLPFGDLDLMAPSLLNYAKNASVPVAVHFDHGFTVEACLDALQHGFTGIMFDGSSKSYEENIRLTRQVVEAAHACGASVEGEIGHVGNAGQDDEHATQYTTCAEARDFIAGTGVDALAISIGTAHGQYTRQPKLDLQRLGEIRDTVDTPLVLHGGSGLTDEDFRNCVRGGICKINIFTDICLAGEKAMKDGLAEGLGYVQIREKKVNAMKEAFAVKLKLFGSANQA